MSDNRPRSEESEQAVLGIVLASPAHALPKLADLDEADFYTPECVAAWNAIRAVASKSGVDAVNPITVWERVKSDGEARRLSQGLGTLMGLAEKAPVAQQLDSHVKTLREKRILRLAIDFAVEINCRAERGEDSKAILDSLWEGAAKLQTMSTFDGTGPQRIGDVFSSVVDVIQRREEKGMRGDILTHIDAFDLRMGGLMRDRHYVIAAGPGVGKSALGDNICANISLIGKLPSLIFSHEMSRQERIERAIASYTKTPLDRVAMGKSCWPEIFKAGVAFQDAPIYIEDNPLTIEQVIATAHRWHAQHVADPRNPRPANPDDWPLAVILVDYLQIVEVSNSKGDSREREIAQVSRALKQLSRTLHIPVISISSLNRKGQEDDQIPKMTNLRGSGAIEYDADVILILTRESQDSDPDSRNRSGPGDAICVKNRCGRVGRIPLWWESEWTTWRDQDPERDFPRQEELPLEEPAPPLPYKD